MDLSPGAKSLVEVSLGVKPEETVMVVVDESRLAVGLALVEACRFLGATGFLTVVPVPTGGVEPPEPVVSAMLDADVVILATAHSLSHTVARRRANRSGTRVASLPGVTEAMLAAGCLTANHEEMEEAMAQAYRRLRKAKLLRLTTPPGTDLALAVAGRSWITDDTGLCRTRGAFATFPAGELLVAPLEGSAEGALVVDLYFHGFLRNAASVTVREGYAVRVEGAREAEEAMDGAGHEGRHLGCLGLGFNPTARLRDEPLEAQKALGVLHVGFGDNLALGGEVGCGLRVDALVKGVTVEADGKVVLEKGKVV